MIQIPHQSLLCLSLCHIISNSKYLKLLVYAIHHCIKSEKHRQTKISNQSGSHGRPTNFLRQVFQWQLLQHLFFPTQRTSSNPFIQSGTLTVETLLDDRFLLSHVLLVEVDEHPHLLWGILLHLADILAKLSHSRTAMLSIQTLLYFPSSQQLLDFLLIELTAPDDLLPGILGILNMLSQSSSVEGRRFLSFESLTT